MIQAEVEVCTDCGNLYLEGGPAPEDVEECGVCGGHLTDVEMDDLIGL